MRRPSKDLPSRKRKALEWGVYFGGGVGVDFDQKSRPLPWGGGWNSTKKRDKRNEDKVTAPQERGGQ